MLFGKRRANLGRDTRQLPNGSGIALVAPQAAIHDSAAASQISISFLQTTSLRVASRKFVDFRMKIRLLHPGLRSLRTVAGGNCFWFSFFCCSSFCAISESDSRSPSRSSQMDFAVYGLMVRWPGMLTGRAFGRALTYVGCFPLLAFRRPSFFAKLTKSEEDRFFLAFLSACSSCRNSSIFPGSMISRAISPVKKYITAGCVSEKQVDRFVNGFRPQGGRRIGIGPDCFSGIGAGITVWHAAGAS